MFFGLVLLVIHTADSVFQQVRFGVTGLNQVIIFGRSCLKIKGDISSFRLDFFFLNRFKTVQCIEVAVFVNKVFLVAVQLLVGFTRPKSLGWSIRTLKILLG